MLKIDNDLCIIDKNKIIPEDFLDKTTYLYKNHEIYGYTDYWGLRAKELYIYFSAENSRKGQLIVSDYPVFISFSDSTGKLRVPIMSGVMKHFFKDYENYYYLKAEDTAVHRSLAEFIDSRQRTRANASNAYTKKEGVFLPQYGEEYTPSFKSDYKSRLSLFELTDDFLSSEEKMQSYLEHLINGVLKC